MKGDSRQKEVPWEMGKWPTRGQNFVGTRKPSHK